LAITRWNAPNSPAAQLQERQELRLALEDQFTQVAAVRMRDGYRLAAFAAAHTIELERLIQTAVKGEEWDDTTPLGASLRIIQETVVMGASGLIRERMNGH